MPAMIPAVFTYTPVVIVIEARTESEFSVARTLFEEYAAAIAVDLCFQSFNHELDHLPEMYGPPGGCLLLARREEEIVGCVGMRRFDTDVCEMKRLYVRRSARGLNVGHLLATSIIERARAAGYQRMV